MMELNWQKCDNNDWCPFTSLNLNHSHFDSLEGVYIIWQANGPIIRLGQGVIKDRIAAHRINNEITNFSNLYVTWASVDYQYRDGIEKYLANTLHPRIGDAFPDVTPIPVTLPWPWS